MLEKMPAEAAQIPDEKCTIPELETRVLSYLLNMEKQQADRVHLLPYDQRGYAAFQVARGVIWALTGTFQDIPEIAVELTRISETLTKSFIG